MNKQKDHPVARENDGLLREIVGRLTLIARDVIHYTKGF